MNKKAITPIISILLMVMLTVAIGSGFYFWYSDVQSSSQQTAQYYNQELLDNMIAETDIVDTPAYNTLAEDQYCIEGTLVFHLQNTGANSIEIDKSKAYIRLWDSNDETICSGIIDGSTISSEYRIYAAASNASVTENVSIYYTTDGTTWTEVLDQAGITEVYDMKVINDKIYYVGYLEAADPITYRSCDGTNFIGDGSKDLSAATHTIEYFNVSSEFYIGDAEGNISSRNYTSWSTRNVTADGAIKGLEVFNGQLYAGTDGVGKIFNTTDGVTWSLIDETMDGVTSMFAYGSYIYVGTDTGDIYRSADGDTWTGVSDTDEADIRAIDTYRDLLFASSYNVSGGSILSSSDGSSWTLNTTFNEKYIYDLAVMNDYLYASTGNNSGTQYGIIYRTNDFVTWTSVLVTKTDIDALTNYTKTTKNVDCLLGCNETIVPGATKYMEYQLTNTGCDISSYGKNTKFRFKISFGTEAHVDGTFTKNLIDTSSTETPCTFTYPMCNGYCNDGDDPLMPRGCLSDGVGGCMCVDTPPCDGIPTNLFECSIGTGKAGCEVGSCVNVPDPDVSQCFCDTVGA
jgi:hypothetical protein